MTATTASQRLEEALRVSAPLTAEDTLLCVTLVALATSDGTLLEAALRRALDRGIERRHIEELLLQGVLFGGFPRTVDAFGLLQKLWGPRGAAPTADPPEREDVGAGVALFDRIYADLAPRVRDELHAYHPALAQWIAAFAYGNVLVRPPLTSRQRELAAVAALAASLCRRQLLSHARGAVRCGASAHEVRAALTLAAACAPQTPLVLYAELVEKALEATA